MEITATEQDIEKRMKRNEDSLRDLWDSKCTSICIIWVPVFALYGSKKEKRKKGPEENI